MALLPGYEKEETPQLVKWVDKLVPDGGTWNWRTNLKDAVKFTMPQSNAEALTNSLLNVGMAVNPLHVKGLAGKAQKTLPGVKKSKLLVGEAPAPKAFQLTGEEFEKRLEEAMKMQAKIQKQIDEIESLPGFNMLHNEWAAEGKPDVIIDKWWELKKQYQWIEEQFTPSRIEGVNDTEKMMAEINREYDSVVNKKDFHTGKGKKTSFYGEEFVDENQYVKMPWEVQKEVSVTKPKYEYKGILQDSLREARAISPAGVHPSRQQDYERYLKGVRLSPLVLDENGKHLTSFHVTNNPGFQEFFNVGNAPMWRVEQSSVDTLLGPHFALKDQAISESFAYNIPGVEGMSAEELMGKVGENTFPIMQTQEVVPGPQGEFYSSAVREVSKGRTMIPAKLFLENPKIVYQPSVGLKEQAKQRYPSTLVWDQKAIMMDALQTVLPESKSWFMKWLRATGRGSYKGNQEAAEQLYKLLKDGDPVPKRLLDDLGFYFNGEKAFDEMLRRPDMIREVGDWNRWFVDKKKNPFIGEYRDNHGFFTGNLADFIYLYDTEPWGYGQNLLSGEKLDLTKLYRNYLEEYGHDALVYINTSLNEVAYAHKGYESVIVWNNKKIKSPWSKFDPDKADFLKGVAGASTGYGAKKAITDDKSR